MILDTGATWCTMDPELVSGLGVSDLGLVHRMIIRGEEYEGRILRLVLTLSADEGEELSFEASVFVPVLYEGGGLAPPQLPGAAERAGQAPDHHRSG